MEKADILIRDCIILPMIKKEIIENGAIAIKNGKITFVGKSAAATSLKAEKEIDAKEKVAMPGLINCHTHLPMTLFRGIAEDQPLDAWLKETIWPLEAKLKANDVYAGALLGCLEMIKSGTTCFADMYFYENMVAKAVEKSGFRGVLAQGIIESGHKLLGAITFRKSVNFAKKFHGYANGRVRTMLGPHAAYSCSVNLFKKIKEKSAELNVGVQIHLAESKAMFKEFEKKHGLSEVEFLDKIGFLNEKVLAAHCIDLSEKDMHILSERSVNVVHAPVANMKLGEGAAKVKDLMDLGVNVCLGTDGPASNNTLDMFETMKTAALLQKHTYRDPTVLPAYEVLKMATINGAKALGLMREVGSIEVGKRADLILVDFSKPHLKPLHNIYASLVYAAHGSDVDTVIIDGKVLMENKQVKDLDDRVVMENTQKAALRLLSR
ncbi:MAG: amidohydrolase [Candidatus Bathyarchaeia archaeon]